MLGDAHALCYEDARRGEFQNVGLPHEHPTRETADGIEIELDILLPAPETVSSLAPPVNISGQLHSSVQI